MGKDDILTIGKGRQKKQFKNVSFQTFGFHFGLLAYNQKQAFAVAHETLKQTFPETVLSKNGDGETLVQYFIQKETLGITPINSDRSPNNNNLKSYMCICDIKTFLYERII